MCSFATRTDQDFNTTMLRFVTASAGLIAPQPGRTSFNLNACFTMPEPVETPERVTAIESDPTRRVPDTRKRRWWG